jgi:alkylhydroperoxidase family enzyme
VENRYSEHVREMERRILHAPGALDPAIRRAAMEGRPLEDLLAHAYAEKVRLHAYEVTDGNIEDLKAAGWSEDQIFELTVAASFGAGKRRLDAGLAALEEALARRQVVAGGAD